MCAAKMVAGFKRWFGGAGRGGGGAGGGGEGIDPLEEEDDFEFVADEASGEYSIVEELTDCGDEDTRTVLTDVSGPPLPRIRACRSATDVGTNHSRHCDWDKQSSVMSRSGGEPVCCCKRCILYMEELYVEFQPKIISDRPHERLSKSKHLEAAGPDSRHVRLPSGDGPPAYSTVVAPHTVVAPQSVGMPRRATVGGDYKGVAREAVRILRTGGCEETVIEGGRRGRVRQTPQQQQQQQRLQQQRLQHTQSSSSSSRHRNTVGGLSSEGSRSSSRHLTSPDTVTSSLPSTGLPPSIAVSLDGEEGFTASGRALTYSTHFRDLSDIETTTLAPPPNRTICHVDS